MRSIVECREIWRRLQNPKTVADYGLSITLEEMTQLPEAEQALMDLPNQGVNSFRHIEHE